MIAVEDLIETLHALDSKEDVFNSFSKKQHSFLDKFETKFISSVSELTQSGKPLFSRQLEVSLKILWKHIDRLVDHYKIPKTQLEQTLLNTAVRRPIVQSTFVPREVRYAGNRKIVFRSKRSDDVTSRIKQLENKFGCPVDRKAYPVFNRKYNVWVVEVSDDNLDKVFKTIKKLNFEFDDALVQFLTDCENSRDIKSSVEVLDDAITVVVQNDPLLSGWLEQTLVLEEVINVRKS